MPLEHSSSKEAFSRNVAREMDAGKPQAQALAIAYRVKRGRKDGGALPTYGQGNMRSEAVEYEKARRHLQSPNWQPPSILGRMLSPHQSAIVDAVRAGDVDTMRSTGYDYPLNPPDRAGGGKVPGFGLGGAPTPWQVKSEARSMMHTGPIMSVVPGRTDRHNVNVASGSYVLPADHVSHHGQNNSLAGAKVIQSMFSSGPYGMNAMRMGHGAGAPRPPKKAGFAAGGAINEGESRGDDTPVPVVVAGGEVILPPEIVRQVGGGDLDHGHAILDSWVKSTRKAHIATLQRLPGPAKS